MIFCDFCGFLDFFLDLDREIVYFYKYLDRDFSSQPYLFTFCASKLASKWAKSAGNSNFFQKVSTKSRFISTKSRLPTNISKNLDLSRFVSNVSIYLDSLDKNLDTAKSRLKSLDFKNLDRDKIKVDLDRRENLDGFQKLVSTIEKSRSRSRYLDLVSTGIAKTVLLDRDRDLSRLIETYRDFSDFL